MPSVIFHPDPLFRPNTLVRWVLGIWAIDASSLPTQGYASSLGWPQPMNDWCEDTRGQQLVSVRDDSKGHPTPSLWEPLSPQLGPHGRSAPLCPTSFLRAAPPESNPGEPFLHAILHFRVCFQETLSKTMLLRRRITMMASSTGPWESGMKQSTFTALGVGAVQYVLFSSESEAFLREGKKKIDPLGRHLV